MRGRDFGRGRVLPRWLTVAIGAQAGEIPANTRRSEYELMSPKLRWMQNNDSADPGMLWVFDGEV
jgi:sulfur-oxidizing protein SoxA